MALDKEAMRKRKAELSRGSSFTPKEGETVLFFCDSGRDEDLANYIEINVHYGLGAKRIPAMCLDAERNPALKDPRVIALVKENKGFDLAAEVKKGCPVCKKIQDPNSGMTEAEMKDQKSNKRFIFPIVPLQFKIPGGADFQTLAPVVLPWNTSYTQWEKITDELIEIGDPTNVEAAVFIKVKRVGMKKNDTKYTIEADKGSLVNPVKLPKPVRALIRKGIAPGSAGDLCGAAADLTRSCDEIAALLSGIQVEQSAPAGDEHEPCFAQDYGADDEDCIKCREMKECAEASGATPPAEAAPDPEAEAKKAKEAKAAKAKKAKAAAAAEAEVETEPTTESATKTEPDDAGSGDDELDELEKALAARKK